MVDHLSPLAMYAVRMRKTNLRPAAAAAAAAAREHHRDDAVDNDNDVTQQVLLTDNDIKVIARRRISLSRNKSKSLSRCLQ